MILRNSLNKLKKYPFFKNVLLVSGGTVIAQAMILLFSPVITRLYSAVDFGIFQQYQAVLNFMVIAAALRYELAILVSNNNDDALALMMISLSITLILFVIFLFTAFGITLTHHHFTFVKDFERYIWFLPFSFLGAGLYQTLTMFIIRQRSFSKISTTKITQSAGLVFGQIFGGYLLEKPFGLFVGDVIGKSLGIATFLSHITKNFRNGIKRITLRDVTRNLKRYREYPFISAPGALLNVAGVAIPSLLIGNFFGLKVLGFYALVDRLFAAPGILIGQSVSQVYMSDASRVANTDPEKLKQTFLRLVRYLAMICIGPLLVAALIAPYAFSIIFGAPWREAGIYLAILAPMQFMAFIAWPLIPTLNLLEKQRWQLGWEILRVSMSCSALLILHAYGVTPRYAIAGYGSAMLLGYLIHLLLSYRAIKVQINKLANRKSE